MIQFDMLSDLKSYDVSAWTGSSLMSSALLVDVVLAGDARGGLYQWSPSLTTTEDLSFYNVIASNTTATGRWVRVFQKVKTLPQGKLVFNGDVKTLYVPSTTNSSGDALFYLTMDGTSTGTPIFSNIFENASFAKVDSTGPATAITSFVRTQAESTSFISTTHGYFKANAVTVTVGLVYTPVTSIGAGTNVVAVVIGT